MEWNELEKYAVNRDALSFIIGSVSKSIAKVLGIIRSRPATTDAVGLEENGLPVPAS